RETVDAQAPLAEEARIELHLDLESGLPDLWADHNRLLQVFDTLIGNAVKFTPEGGRVEIKAVAKDQEVLFSVTDTGPGIAPANVPHIFAPFWQAATRERRLGAGLGLPITKGIVEAHGGRIWVESTE